MPFPFTLPTTSATSLTSSFSSSTHPSLILTATSQRALVRDALKKHKRLPNTSQISNLTMIQDVLNAYIPYLLTIYNGAPDAQSITSYGGQLQIPISENAELITEWRSTLTSGVAGREPQRVKVKGLRNEFAFMLQTLAYTYSHLARTALYQLQKTTSPTSEIRAGFIATAMKQLLEAHSIHSYVSSLAVSDEPSTPIDVSTTTASALASLTLAEATLIVVLRDDPYAAAVAEDRNKDSKEWMIAAPSIPKVRAHLFARLCIAAADHAAKASSLLPKLSVLGPGRIDESLIKYADDLRKTARGKAARFLGIDAEGSAKTGEAISWLRGAKKELGVFSDDATGSRKGFRGLKQNWSEKREDRRVEKGGDDWGLDAGRLEEIRVVEWLEAKWVKSNDTINVQTIPASEPLMAAMPSGREYHTPKPYTPRPLDASQLDRLRAPVDPSQRAFIGNEADSGDESTPLSDPPGAFPGTAQQYDSSNTSYF